MDATATFRSLATAYQKSSGKPADDTTLLRSRRPGAQWLTEFSVMSRAIKHTHMALVAHLQAYLASDSMSGSAGSITDGELARQDREAFAFLKKCEQRLAAFRNEASQVRDRLPPQKYEVMINTTESIYLRLRDVGKLIQTVRTVRHARAKASGIRLQVGRPQASTLKGARGSTLAVPTGSTRGSVEWEAEALPPRDADEAAVLATQNLELLTDLEQNTEAVRELERMMMEISQLMTVFTTKLAEQQEDIEALHRDAVSSKQSVSKGNALLIDATEQSFFSRFFVLIFLIVASATLLLLDFLS